MKLKEYMNARNDGMNLALRVAEEKGIEGLKEEIKFRSHNPLPSSVTKEAYFEAMKKLQDRTIDVIMLVANCVLDREFGFGKKRLGRFSDRFNLIMDCLSDTDNVTLNELNDNLLEETGYKISFRDEKAFAERG